MSNRNSNTEVSQSNTIVQMEKKIEDLSVQSAQAIEIALSTILKAVNSKDNYSLAHAQRVCDFSLMIGEELGLSQIELSKLRLTAMYHDIGKIEIPEYILTKPSRLNEEEYFIIRKHPLLSSQILKNFDQLKDLAEFVKHHHERFDGKGYPNGLSGESIPLFSRILFIADSFDTMTSSRIYQKGLSFDVALNSLIKGSGTQFDPELVQHFVKRFKEEQHQTAA